MSTSISGLLKDVYKTAEKEKTPTKLSPYIDPFLDVLIFIAFAFAGIKDLADITIGLLPVIGSIFVFMISVFCSIFLFLIMTLLGGRKMSFLVKRLLIIAVGFFLESTPLLRFLPIEICVVFINYMLILKERRVSHEERRKLQNQQIQESYA